MPLQNRVDPWGHIFRSAARGTLMGNRGGRIHDDRQGIIRDHAGKRWISCVLSFKGRQRKVMTDGYTELFFLDEAVALSAGHRPCAECQRPRFNEFRQAWHRYLSGQQLPADKLEAMDAQFHLARWHRRNGKITFQSPFGLLPEGVFVQSNGDAFLLWRGRLRRWTPEGYSPPVEPFRSDSPVEVLTPAPIVECLRAGYTPAVHLPD